MSKRSLLAHAEHAALEARLEREREDAKRREQIIELRRLLSAKLQREESLAAIRDLVALAEPRSSRLRRGRRRAPRATPTRS